jgi:uncharacterized protein YgiM (DUF1202 family)
MKNKLSILIFFLMVAITLSACARQPLQVIYAPAIAISPTNATPGTLIAVYGAGFPSAAHVQIFITVAGKDFPPQLLGTATTNDKGQLQTTFTAPQLEQGNQAAFVVSVQTADETVFATSTLMLEAETVAIVAPPTATLVPGDSPTPNINTEQDETCQANADKAMIATVASETLNVRFGPGTNHQIVTMLSPGDEVVMKGRTADNLWVEVTLADCRGGWVYAVYLKTDASIASLPFTAGAGGPVSDDPSGAPTDGRSGIWISIENNVAFVTVKGLPANQNVTLSIATDNKSLENISSKLADSTGTANFKFTMPARWGDGSIITQSNIWLTATSADGTTKTVEVIYYH